MMAGDSKIWIAAIFMLVSYLYRAYKKKNQEKSEDGNEGSSSETSGGFSDLIRQFEDAINPQVNSQPVSVKSYDQEPEYSEEYGQEYSSEYVSDNVEYLVDQDPVEVLVEKPQNQVKKEKSKDKPYGISTEVEAEIQLDLRAMIIHKAILDRPEY